MGASAGNGRDLRQAALLWGAGLAIMAYGAWAIRPGSDHPLLALDRQGLQAAHAWRSDALDHLMAAVTWLGSLWLLLPASLLAALVLLYRRQRTLALFITLGLLGASLLSHLTKLAIMRPRPDLFPLLTALPADWSYPSAHTMQATAVGLMVVLLAGRYRLPWAVAASLLVLLVAASRVYLQVHFPSDVVIGAMTAALWVTGLHVWMRAQLNHRGPMQKGDDFR